MHEGFLAGIRSADADSTLEDSRPGSMQEGRVGHSEAHEEEL